jgi:hypothetical protein
MPSNSLHSRNKCRPSGPPSPQAKQGRAVSTRWVISPPSSTRTTAPAGAPGSCVWAKVSAVWAQIRLGGTAPDEVEVGAVEVDVAGRVDDELVPALGAMAYGGAVRLDPSEFLTGDQEPAVGQPVDGPTHAGAARSDHLASTVHVDGYHFAATPVREPQAAVMPTGRLDHREAVGQQPRSRKHDGHGAHSTRVISKRIRASATQADS